jgi:hypothetical protein
MAFGFDLKKGIDLWVGPVDNPLKKPRDILGIGGLFDLAR